MEFYFETDKAIIRELGRRLKEHRLRVNMTQTELARAAGVSRMTIEFFEAGKNIKLQTFIQLLRVFNQLKALDVVLPEITVSPKQLFLNEGRKKKRASKKRK